MVGITKKRVQRTRSDLLFDIGNVSFLLIASLLVLYPLYFVVIASISNPDAVNNGRVLLRPIGTNLEGYRFIFHDRRIWTGYRNTIIYTGFGTLLDVVVTVLAGYALSRKDMVGRNIIMVFFMITMYFNGGLIPFYLVVRALGLYNTRYVMIILGATSVFRIIITRTYFASTIPDELLESAVMDGCSNQRFFGQIVLPLSKPILAVMALYFAVDHWNQFFQALIFLARAELYPLQLVLREILIQSEAISQSVDLDITEMGVAEQLAEMVKYGVIIVSSVPVLLMYPFVQRYFVKGVMIGAIKG